MKSHRIVASTDPGYAVNPAQIERQIAGSFVYGLSALFYQECTVKEGAIEQTNFDSYDSMRISDMPEVECIIMPSGGFWGGVGEPTIFVAAPAVQCLPVPANLTVEEAAALPETFFTVFLNVFLRVGLRAGETLLIHGGSSGIGTTAIMLAKAFDARVIVTAGSAEKCAACLELGADHAINYKAEDFVAATQAVTQGRGADVILDMVAGDYVPRNIAAAAVDGRIAIIAHQGGARADVDIRAIMIKRLTLSGSTLRAQPVANKGRIAAALRSQVWPLFATKRLRPVIQARFPLAEASRAHALMESGTHIGKIVLVSSNP